MSSNRSKYSVGCLPIALAVACGSTNLPNPVDSDMASPFDAAISSTHSAVPSCNRSDIDAAKIAIDYQKEILITDVSVVDDPCRTSWRGTDASGSACAANAVGHWTFGYVMQQLAGNVQVNAFMEAWAKTYSTKQLVNGANDVLPRPKADLLTNSDWATNKMYSVYDAPFRLLAIVNRVDLESLSMTSGYGSAKSLGEGRMVFGVLGSDGSPLRAVVIFEYNLPSTSLYRTSSDWANAWHKLGSLSGEAYRAQLQVITDEFLAPQGAAQGPNNGSSIAHVRSNEVAFTDDKLQPNQWEMRSYTLQEPGVVGLPPSPCRSNTCMLLPSTLDGTPYKTLNKMPILQDLAYKNSSAILSQSFAVPPRWVFKGNSIQILSSSVQLNGMANEEVWSFTPDNTQPVDYYKLRQSFAFSTCNGCHYNETGTFNLHIQERYPNQPASVSSFLQYRDLSNPGVQSITDPGGPSDVAINLGFNEPRRRACEMVRLIAAPNAMRFSPLNNVVRH